MTGTSRDVTLALEILLNDYIPTRVLEIGGCREVDAEPRQTNVVNRVGFGRAFFGYHAIVALCAMAVAMTATYI